MEGRQPNRHGESLTRRQKQVFGGAAAALMLVLGGVGAWAATGHGSYGSYGGSRDGCVNVTVPSTTGGAVLHQCGATARATCHQVFLHHDRLSMLTRAQCRLAGLGPSATTHG